MSLGFSFLRKPKDTKNRVEKVKDFIDDFFEEETYFVFAKNFPRTKDLFSIIFEEKGLVVLKPKKWNYVVIEGLTPLEQKMFSK